jgi:hypothetical protein
VFIAAKSVAYFKNQSVNVALVGVIVSKSGRLGLRGVLRTEKAGYYLDLLSDDLFPTRIAFTAKTATLTELELFAVGARRNLLQVNKYKFNETSKFNYLHGNADGPGRDCDACLGSVAGHSCDWLRRLLGRGIREMDKPHGCRECVDRTG